MIRVLIVEDEHLALEYLEDSLLKTGHDIEVVGRSGSVKDSIKWFLKNEHPDLIFMDIDLGDGLCFEIFDVIEIIRPIVFTTAYDEYAIKAFKVNSIDYLLKPVDPEDLSATLDKYAKLGAQVFGQPMKVKGVGQLISGPYKERFIIKIGDHLKSIPVGEAAYFMSRDKATFLMTDEGRNFLIDYSLDALEEVLDPGEFYRVNRSHIIHFQSIRDVVVYSNSRLRVMLAKNEPDGVVVSRDRVVNFKKWLDR